MATELRNTGISAIGNIPWGAHFCCFYDTKEDLLDILIPYFKTGLENNEFCLWVISNSELVTVDEALAALRSAVPDLDRYLAEGSLEIVGHDDWFLRDGALNLHQVANQFKEKLEEVLARGYVGMRINGSPAWLQLNNAKELPQFEEELDQLFSHLPILASCTYPLSTMGGDEVFDTVHTHQFAIARRRGGWEVIESPELRQAKTEIARLNKELQLLKKHSPARPFVVRYGVPVLAIAVALLITTVLRMQIGQPRTPFVAVCLCAVMFSAWFAGFRSGLLTIVISFLAFKYFFAPPLFSPDIEMEEIPRLVIFTLSAFFIAFLSASQRTVAESLRRARDVLDETVQELKRSNQALRMENAERKQAEALVYAKEQEFRAIVENAPDHIIRYDREFRRVYVNPAVAKAYGLPEQALIGKPVGSVVRDSGLDIKPSQVDQVRERIASVFDTGKSNEFELSWPLVNGQRELSVRLFPELDMKGEVINVLGITRDITERTRVEAQLKKEKEVLEKIFANIPMMIAFIGENGAIKLVNPEWEHTIGWTLQEIQSQNVDIYTEAYPDPEYRQKVHEFIAAATGEWADLRVKVRDGRVIDVACAMVLLSDGTRLVIAHDITVRKQAEEALRQSEDRLRLVIDTIPIMAWTVRPDGTVDFLNQRWMDFSGLSLEHYVRDPMGPIHPDDTPRVLKKWSASIAVGETYEDEMRLRGTDGKYRWFLVRTAPVRDEGGKVIKWYGVSTDIDDLKSAEERIRTTSEQLRAFSTRLQYAKEEEDIRIAREIHDEMGSGLASLRWELEELDKSISEAEDWSQREAVRTKIDGMIRLTDVTISTMRRIAAELRPSILDDLGLVEAIEWQTQQFQARTGIDSRCDCALENLDFDPEQSTAIFRIFQETLTNVLRHAKATAIEVSMREENGEFVLTISDNGRGIREHEKSGRRSLGILGMRERALLIGADFEITGIEGEGTKITLRMPIGRNAAKL
jgi:PAS domain S-box-containing protein